MLKEEGLKLIQLIRASHLHSGTLLQYIQCLYYCVNVVYVCVRMERRKE